MCICVLFGLRTFTKIENLPRIANQKMDKPKHFDRSDSFEAPPTTELCTRDTLMFYSNAFFGRKHDDVLVDHVRVLCAVCRDGKEMSTKKRGDRMK